MNPDPTSTGLRDAPSLAQILDGISSPEHKPTDADIFNAMADIEPDADAIGCTPAALAARMATGAANTCDFAKARLWSAVAAAYVNAAAHIKESTDVV